MKTPLLMAAELNPDSFVDIECSGECERNIGNENVMAVNAVSARAIGMFDFFLCNEEEGLGI